jgi:hypothetical protein
MLNSGFAVRADPARIDGALRERFLRFTCYGYIERFAYPEVLSPAPAPGYIGHGCGNRFETRRATRSCPFARVGKPNCDSPPPHSSTPHERHDVSAIRNWGVFVYFVAVLFDAGFLFAITALPGNPADLFPNPSPDELVQVVQWIWEGPTESSR